MTALAVGVPVADVRGLTVVAAMPLSVDEQVEVLKSQLGLRGDLDLASVVNEAATQLGVEAVGKPLSQVAAECMRALGA